MSLGTYIKIGGITVVFTVCVAGLYGITREESLVLAAKISEPQEKLLPSTSLPPLRKEETPLVLQTQRAPNSFISSFVPPSKEEIINQAVAPIKNPLSSEEAPSSKSINVAAALLEKQQIRSISGRGPIKSQMLDEVVEDSLPLFITTHTLGVATVGEQVSVNLQAQGGKPPYSWQVINGALPSGLLLDAQLGSIQGVPEEEQTTTVRFQVVDEQGKSDSADIPMSVFYGDSLGEEGDTEEFTEEQGDTHTENLSPQSLQEEIVNDEIEKTAEEEPIEEHTSGSASHHSDRENDDKNDDHNDELLPLLDLQARASDGKVGLVWKNPVDPLFVGAQIVRQQISTPLTPEDGVIVYSSSGNNVVDSGLENGVTYFYSGFAIYKGTSSGEKRSSSAPIGAPVTATPRAVSLAGGADPFIDEVVTFTPLDPSNSFGSEKLPGVVLGAPQGGGEWSGSFDVVSLHAAAKESGKSVSGGSITIRFTNNIVVDGQGSDFTIFENAFRERNSDSYWIEPAVVDVSADGVTYYRFPFDFVPHYKEDGTLNLSNPFSYAEGFAGVRPVLSVGTQPSPIDPAVSGGDHFDLSALPGLPLKWIQYVRITSTGDGYLRDKNGDIVRHSNDPFTWAASGTGNSGFDLDAVGAVNF